MPPRLPPGKVNAGERPLPRGMEHCVLCGACSDACPTAARELVGSHMTVDELLPLLLRDRLFYDDSGGGVTFSGGEPLLQFEFLPKPSQPAGPNDSIPRGHCGFVPTSICWQSRRSRTCSSSTSNASTPIKHRHYTGASNDLILQNLQALGRVHPNIWVRVPVIPGINDTRDELDADARLTASLAGVRQVNLLPYHRTGVRKSERLGKNGFLAGLQPPTAEASRMLLRFSGATGSKPSPAANHCHERAHCQTPPTEPRYAAVHLRRARRLLTGFTRPTTADIPSPSCAPGPSCIFAEHKTIYIGEDELIVGERGPAPKVRPHFPRADLPQPRGSAHPEFASQDLVSRG